jgi:hypothetical protein
MAVVRGLLDALAIMPGETVLEVGCGSGVIMCELARPTGGANRLIGRDINPYLLREALATKQQLLHLYGGLLGVAPSAVGVDFQWAQPVGIAVAQDCSLLVSEDGNGSIWRVS